ncbi:MAG: acetate--CoA ligase [Alphaproteobacteria bacterium]|nr:acetate--CoA ligase [Alphaproteobacteria bacterium]
MSDIFPVSEAWKQRAHITLDDFKEMSREALKTPEKFWEEQASAFAWRRTWDKVSDCQFERPVRVNWFSGARLNITENCLDRHLPERANQTAIIWEGDDPDQSKHITYQQLFDDVCRMANVLTSLGVEKGDRVTIYLPMIPEAAVAMLACARIGAVHSVVFGGFSADALKGRIQDCGSKVVITADEGRRGGKTVPLKAATDLAVADLAFVEHVVVVKNTGAAITKNARDRWYHELAATVTSECNATIVEATDPLFILYTSGSTGKPKGVLHSSGGYMVWAGMTHKIVFDYHAPVIPSVVEGSFWKKDLSTSLRSAQDDKTNGDIYWCTADVGWITGHTYIVYGPLLNGATTLMFEGVPSYPDSSRFWQVIDKHKVNIFYTAPTAIRALMREGDAFVTRTSRASLRLLGSVGEPINPEAWLWYHRVVGDSRCPIMDTWWQTETGGHMITPLPGATPLKPGSATWPFFGVQPVIMDANGKEMAGECEGMLCIKASWPGQMNTVYGDHARFEETYFATYPGYYFTGDGARRDADGYYWITGRADDVLKISGHRIGTADVESALVGHAHVTEAAVVGIPHEIKGQGIYCYVTLASGVEPSEAMAQELKQWVRKTIGAIATPEHIQFTPALPKTRSGKIMRRILRKIAEGDTSNLGDTSTLTNPEVVAMLVRGSGEN